MFDFCYRKHCIEGRGTLLEEGERTAFTQSPEWESSGEDGDVSEIADELEGGPRSVIKREREQTVPNF